MVQKKKKDIKAGRKRPGPGLHLVRPEEDPLTVPNQKTFRPRSGSQLVRQMLRFADQLDEEIDYIKGL